MSREPIGAPAGASAPEADLSRTYLLVILVEIVVVAGLYWLGRHFA